MLINYRQHITTKEIVFEEDEICFAMDKLGIEIKPLGANGVFLQEQVEFMNAIVEWYYSGDWCTYSATLEELEEMGL